MSGPLLVTSDAQKERTMNANGTVGHACTCNWTVDADRIHWYDELCPVDDHAEAATVQAREEGQYAKAERAWNWDIPRGGL